MNIKRVKTTCNICYELQTDLKCNKCSFECCYQCIYEWTEKSRNCPQCRNFESYNIEYPEESSDPELFSIFLGQIEMIDNESVDNESVDNESVDNESVDNESNSDEEDPTNENLYYNYLTLNPLLINPQYSPIEFLFSPPPTPPPSPSML